MKIKLCLFTLLSALSLHAQEVERFDIKLTDGTVYQNSRISENSARQIVITNPSGITTINKVLLAEEFQKKFGFDPEVARAEELSIKDKIASDGALYQKQEIARKILLKLGTFVWSGTFTIEQIDNRGFRGYGTISRDLSDTETTYSTRTVSAESKLNPNQTKVILERTLRSTANTYGTGSIYVECDPKELNPPQSWTGLVFQNGYHESYVNYSYSGRHHWRVVSTPTPLYTTNWRSLLTAAESDYVATLTPEECEEILRNSVN